MPSVDAAVIDGWLADLELVPLERAERDGIHSWDLSLDGRQRADIRVTLILDPARTLLCWVHFAPPLNDSFRISYRQFLRWNDDFPYVKFALAADDRPVLTSELPLARLDRDGLGIAICRLLAVCDVTLERSVAWLWPGAREAPAMDRASRQSALFERYGDIVAELLPDDGADEGGGASAEHHEGTDGEGLGRGDEGTSSEP